MNWIEGPPTKDGLYLVNIGYRFLDNKLGYQNQLVTIWWMDGEARETYQGLPVGKNWIKQHININELL